VPTSTPTSLLNSVCHICAPSHQIYKANEKLDGFKLLMNWNQEELEQWALAQRQKEEDNAALEKYRHQDAAKVWGTGVAAGV
jgi:hypothetical protein